MKRKKYEVPTMDVIKLKQQPHLLAGSDGQAGVQDYNWQTVDEE